LADGQNHSCRSGRKAQTSAIPNLTIARITAGQSLRSASYSPCNLWSPALNGAGILMPKAYNEDRGNLVDVQRSGIAPTAPDETPFSIAGRPVRIGMAEAIGCLSAFYLICIASFNAGYFSSVGGRFVALFSFSDLVGINIPILQYFLSVYTAYSLLGMIHSLALNDFFKPAQAQLDEFILDSFHWSNKVSRLFWVALLVAFVSLVLALDRESFNVAIAPYFLFQGFGIYILWVGWKNYYVSAKTLVISSLLGVIYFSSTSGGLWARDDIRYPAHLQSITLKNGQCLDRIFMRTNSAGYLLYSIDLKQFEFRNKDDIATIFATKGCL
jgi:hypothetical protein